MERMVGLGASAADVLLRAAEIIEKRGWTQGLLEKSPGGAVCVIGAINLASLDDPRYARWKGMERRVRLATRAKACAIQEAERRLDKLPRWRNFRGDAALTTYNDQVARRGQTIVRFLRAAAKRCDESAT